MNKRKNHFSQHDIWPKFLLELHEKYLKNTKKNDVRQKFINENRNSTYFLLFLNTHKKLPVENFPKWKIISPRLGEAKSQKIRKIKDKPFVKTKTDIYRMDGKKTV